jgi:hypothetical protein
MYQRLAKVAKEQRALQEKKNAFTGEDEVARLQDDRDAFYENLANCETKPNIAEFNPCLQSFLTTGLLMRVVTKNFVFDVVVNFAIVFAGLLVGISFYPSLENSKVLMGLEWFVLAIFTAEVRIQSFNSVI